MPLASVVAHDNMAVYVKWMHIGIATGDALPFVFLIAVDDFGLGDDFYFYFYEVKQLRWSVGASPGYRWSVGASPGYLCFASPKLEQEIRLFITVVFCCHC